MIIFIRRTTDDEYGEAMGHWWKVPGAGAHKLVRIEVNLKKGTMKFYRIMGRVSGRIGRFWRAHLASHVVSFF